MNGGLNELYGVYYMGFVLLQRHIGKWKKNEMDG